MPPPVPELPEVEPDEPDMPEDPDVPDEPDMPDEPDEPDVPEEPDIPEEPDMPEEPVDPFVLPLPLDAPDVEPVPERRAFSRAMQASRSAVATFWQIAVGSSARLAGTRLLVVLEPDIEPPVVAPLVPLVPLVPLLLPDVPPVCAVAAAAVPSATANAKALSCIMFICRLLMEWNHSQRSGSRRFHARPECASAHRRVIGLPSLRA